MGLFDGLFGAGGFNPQAPSDPGMPMAINQQGAQGQSAFGGSGGGLLGLNFGQPIADIGGQGQGLLGFGASQQANPMMRFGLGMAGMPQQQPSQQMDPQTMQQMYARMMMAPRQQQQPAPGINPHSIY